MKHALRLTVLVLLLNVAAFGAEKDTVVKIEFNGGKCSGVVVSSDGYILTAEHCVGNMKGDIWVLIGDSPDCGCPIGYSQSGFFHRLLLPSHN